MIYQENHHQPLNGNNDHYWMTQALKMASIAFDNDEVPVGAILVDSENKFFVEEHNKVIQTNDATAHAEILAIRGACNKISNNRLLNSTLYITMEPCAMCAGAIVQARIKRVVFGTRDFKAGAAGSVYNLLKGYPLNHQVQVDEGILQQSCSKILQDFFIKCRIS